MGKFKRLDTSIDGVYVIEPTVFGDNREIGRASCRERV